jgi:hypothetical protein
MELVTGKIKKAKKVVIYGPEGIGKSTFVSHFPAPVFIDTEGSTDELDVIRTKNPTSWTMLLDQVKYFIKNPSGGTLIIDTADWAERLCTEHICAKNNWESIESLGYGKGFVHLEEEWGRFLNLLNEVICVGTNVALVCHAILRAVNQPEEFGGYDHWELKLQKKTAALTKEWANLLLFANYKVRVVKEGEKDKKGKARDGKRVMYASHHPCWDAKNRYNLPDEIEFDFDAIAHIVTDMLKAPAVPVTPAPKPEDPKASELPPEASKTDKPPEPEVLKAEAPKADGKPATPPATADKAEAGPADQGPNKEEYPPHLGPLLDIMKQNFVTPEMIQKIVAKRGYFPADTPIENYPPDFVSGVLVEAWPKVFKMICDEDGEPTPF